MENEITEHLRALFVGVTPERTQELEEFWGRFSPVVQIVPDDDQGEVPVMEAGMYRYLRFNHRILRMIWLLGFSAWEGRLSFANARDFMKGQGALPAHPQFSQRNFSMFMN